MNVPNKDSFAIFALEGDAQLRESEFQRRCRVRRLVERHFPRRLVEAVHGRGERAIGLFAHVEREAELDASDVECTAPDALGALVSRLDSAWNTQCEQQQTSSETLHVRAPIMRGSSVIPTRRHTEVEADATKIVSPPPSPIANHHARELRLDWVA